MIRAIKGVQSSGTVMQPTRPVIFDFQSSSLYVASMLQWRRVTSPDFSLRKITKDIPGCSAALVSQIANGKRQLTRDRVDSLAQILALTPREQEYLDRWIALQRSHGESQKQALLRPALPTVPRNHLLSNWLNLYVKDSSRLSGFKPEAGVIHRLLSGIASIKHIQRSLDFLLREGFLRHTVDGKVVEDEIVSHTTSNIPDGRIRAFHKRALDITKRSIDLYPVEMRQSCTVVLPLDAASFDELKDIVRGFQDRLAAFAESHSKDQERLYQVVVHLSPIGGSSHGVEEPRQTH